MLTPQEIAAGYDAGSAIEAAKSVPGQVVLLHGSLHDNVHLHGTMQLQWDLQSARTGRTSSGFG